MKSPVLPRSPVKEAALERLTPSIESVIAASRSKVATT